MSTSRKVWICTVLLSLPMLAGQGIIQPFPAQAAPEAESLIRLHVVVNDKSGKPVSGLEQKDFTVVDNKQPEKITAVQDRHKSDDPCCKRGLYVPGTGVLRLRSAAVRLRLLPKCGRAVAARGA